VLLVASGTVPMGRLQGRSLDMVVAGTSANELPSRLKWKRPKPGAPGRGGRIGNDAAFSMCGLPAGRGRLRS